MGSPCHHPYSMHVEMPMGASIKYVRNEGEGGSKSRKICVR